MSFVDLAVGVGLTGFLEAGIGTEAAAVLGPVLMGGATSAGMGAATSAITGQDPGKGALIGGLTGAIGGGLGGVLGGIGDTAEAAAPMEAAGVTTPSAVPSLTSDIAPATTQLANAPTALPELGTAAAPEYESEMEEVGEPISSAFPSTSTPYQGATPTVSPNNYNLSSQDLAKGLTSTGVQGNGGPSASFDPMQWISENKGTAAMGALGLGTAAYGMMHPTNYGIPSSSTVNQGPITPYKYDPSKYQPNYPVPNVYVPHYAEGGIAQLADGGMAGTPPNMLDGPADLDFMGGGAFPMSQQTRSFYASPTQMPTSAQQAMASYEPNTNPLTGEPVAHMAQGGIAQLAVGGKLLHGPGDGVSDSIHANIGGRQEARLADGEFVIPARIVSELGNGSTDAGAKQLYAMMNRVQNHRRRTVGKDKVAVDSKARKALPA